MSPSFVLKLSFNLLNFCRGHPVVLFKLKENTVFLARDVQELVTQEIIYIYFNDKMYPNLIEKLVNE